MSALVLDAGALIAVDRDERAMAIRLKAAADAGFDLRTTGAVLAQVWRDPGGRQARLARFLRSVAVLPIDADVGRAAGVLLGRTGMSDAVDATLVAAASDGDQLLTSDPGDLGPLVAASRRPIRVLAV